MSTKYTTIFSNQVLVKIWHWNSVSYFKQIDEYGMKQFLVSQLQECIQTLLFILRSLLSKDMSHKQQEK